jgi:2-polyprenyl-3-methyl-5-hydroxy-6-metoxy-1,4-benzoquinol methylase
MVTLVPETSAGRYVAKDFPHSSHLILVGWVGREPVRVLDVGAAGGHLGAMLADRGHTVVGVERDPASAAAARKHYKAFYELDIEAGLELPEPAFDVVIAGDVIEHLGDAVAGLRILASRLQTRGRILISVPNIAFVTVRLGLLCGRFEPAPRGILDATHLHFFTRRSVRRLVADAGLRVVRMRGVPPPLPLMADWLARWPGRLLLEGANLAATVWPTMFAYQWIIEAAP